MKVQHIFFTGIFISGMMAACATSNPNAAKANLTADRAPRADIVETAASAGQFTTLVAAVKAAGLAGTLKSDGPFTVFAPTDDAFARLPAGTVEQLLKPENKDKLASILTYHVVPGRIMAADVASLSSARTAQGQLLSVRTVEGNVMIDQATVVKANIRCRNGVIHVIDQVVLPKPDGQARAAGNKKTM